MADKTFELQFKTEVQSILQVTEQELIPIILRTLATEIANMSEKELSHPYFQNIHWDGEIIGTWRFK